MVDLGRIPGPLVIPNCVQVNLNWRLVNGKTVHNALHASVGTAFVANGTIAEAVFAHIKASAAWTAWKALLSGDTLLEGVDIRDLRIAELPLVSSTGGADSGTGVTNAVPPMIALCVTLRTALAGRSKRGRVYLCGFDTADIDASGGQGGLMGTPAINFVTEVQAAMGAQAMTMAIANPARQAYTGKKGNLIPARPASVAQVTGITVRSTTYQTQRRRGRP